MNDVNVAVEWIDLGYLAYDDALDIQLARANALLGDKDERQTVFVVEHPSTITIGRNGTTENILVGESQLDEMGFVVRHVDRGGDVTYHGPGQLVVYPVLHLDPWANDVKAFVRRLEEVVIRSLHFFGIDGERNEAYPGVWVGGAKICAVGARVKKRPHGEFVTYHGLALNVNTELAHFSTIVPCGIQDKDVTSIQRELGALQDFAAWSAVVRDAFYSVFAAVPVATRQG